MLSVTNMPGKLLDQNSHSPVFLFLSHFSLFFKSTLNRKKSCTRLSNIIAALLDRPEKSTKMALVIRTGQNKIHQNHCDHWTMGGNGRESCVWTGTSLGRTWQLWCKGSNPRLGTVNIVMPLYSFFVKTFACCFYTNVYTYSVHQQVFYLWCNAST